MLRVACSRTLVFLGCLVLTSSAFASGAVNFRAHASGAEEVPPQNTIAQGEVILRLNGDGTALWYKLIVANIEDVLMAHLHVAPPGSNGPVVVWLYPDGPPPVLIDGRVNGVIAAGVITAADLVGPLAGQTLADLVAEIESGNVYVNVHTVAVPAGEIRGQL